MTALFEDFASRVIDWQSQHGRHQLPWQHQDAYRVWLSEIMLQQTQVTTVIPYYLNFVEHFPDIIALANASSDAVLQHWQGLGYYARARNLHKAAQIIRDQHQGQFPSNIEDVEALPGIGRSTAGAILSFAFEQSWPILDGNVKRVLARCFQVQGWYGQSATMQQLWQLSEQITPGQQTAVFNQAMMDIGSMLCVKSKPKCEACPLTENCASFRDQTQLLFPHKKPKKTRPLRQTLMLLHRYGDELLLWRRPESGIWGGLWSLPEVEDAEGMKAWQQNKLACELSPQNLQQNLLRHQFSHYNLDISLASFDLADQTEAVSDGDYLRWVAIKNIGSYGLPTPVRKILNMVIEE
ncbi:MAG: A/G-specific adenine glycosylase [Gammaproteobacteria bacterium]|jgi:A/G-specific adenine glycosylase